MGSADKPAACQRVKTSPAGNNELASALAANKRGKSGPGISRLIRKASASVSRLYVVRYFPLFSSHKPVSAILLNK